MTDTDLETTPVDANCVYAGPPSGKSKPPEFRALVEADLQRADTTLLWLNI